MNWLLYDDILKNAIKEDAPFGDVTTSSIVDESNMSQVELLCKEDGIIAGLQVFKRVFQLIDDVDIEFFVNDGDEIKKGQLLAIIKGKTHVLLTGERTALNLLQRMSGIATLTSKFVNELKGTSTKLLDTRKTTPNLRVFEKYAVKVGGGTNHRFGLSDGVMLKDNHIAAAGGIKNAVELVRKNAPFVRKIEVETETLEQVQEALDAAAHIIMLDNMDIETMKKAVKLISGKAETEASGNVSLDNIKEVATSGVDFISTGAITHSFKVLDLSLKNLKNI
ncbi:nicotinate-nucleotide diphosphorylase (carboxylating) [Clostridium polyendosporum]|uniref:Probable nicotinate-nucleotide pyrophosphorylase [carboxylating] n=1 Tax=Clostridium polyendosporum TaxID=69208 RepID=A0A919RZZ9_9CLOT|nr:carboxylating nicotinate-nucleotide diphosphorylase [Clostridium polyendosporum]GIM29436.1 nicotinate-nucleotide diphosphorylase (carboxylating) [Clostridium polyendosporum]